MAKKFWGADALETGTYTPVITNPVNITATTVYLAKYQIVGDIVTVHGRIDINVTTTATLSTFEISLPEITNFTSARQASGSLVNAFNECFTIQSEPTNDTAKALGTPITTANTGYNFIIMYSII